MNDSFLIYFFKFHNNTLQLYCILSPNDLGSKVEKNDRNNEIK